MSNFNDIFEDFPDYNVFDEENAPIKSRKKEKLYGDNDFIEYDEKRDFRTKRQRVKKAVPDEEYEPEHSTDYRDGYGVYIEYEQKVRNYGTIFYFPILMIWLEGVLRFACGEGLLSINMLYVVLFSLSISAIFTAICTLFGERFNRVLVKLISLILTVWYCVQIVYFNMSGNFLLFSAYTPIVHNLNDFNTVMDVMSYRVYYLLACFVPFVFNLFAGKYLFPFRRIRLPAKICLLLVAVLLHFTAITAVSVSKNSENPASAYVVYHQDYSGYEVQEKFGLYTMERKDFFN